jgi:UDP-N-acetyl-2-amino-2-deoxyglucuronate dehydrogenase
VTRLRVAVVGLEHYHVTGWARTIELLADDLEIVALYDRDPGAGRRLAPLFVDPALPRALDERYRALPMDTDLQRLIEQHQPDVALVTLPDRDAPEAIERLGTAGVHLVVDKPAARSAAEARRAFAAARAGGARVVVGLTRRYSPAARAAKRFVQSGSLGRLVTGEAIFAAASVVVRGRQNPLFDARLSAGGVLAWLGVHDLDALPWLAGEPVVEVQAMTARRATDDLAVEDVASVALRLAGGAIVTIHHAYALPARGYRAHLALRGLDASIEMGLGEELTIVTRDPDGDGLREERQTFAVPEVPGYGASGLEAVRDLVAAIREGRDPAVTGEDLVRALELIEAAYESATRGRIVRVAG